MEYANMSSQDRFENISVWDEYENILYFYNCKFELSEPTVFCYPEQAT